MRFTTILFDLDHTLLDSNTSEALAFDATMRRIDVDDPTEHLATYRDINSRLWRQVELGEITPNEVKVTRFEQLLDTLGLDEDPAALGSQYLIDLGDHGELYPDARDLLDTLQPRTMGLVTNGIGQVQRRRIERLGLAPYFDGVAISGEAGVAKPDPAIFGHLGLPGLAAETTVMIGDSLTSDIAAGANAGMATCWYNPHGKPVSGPVTPTVEVSSLAAIPQALATL